MSSFKELGLSQEIVQAVEELGYSEPTLIQNEAIPALLAKKQDMLGLAQTGTGKTAAFGLPLIDLVDKSKNVTQGLVIAPTRELANQIAKDLMGFSKYKFLRTVVVYGGASIQTQIEQIRKGAQIIIATPGRLMDLMERRVIQLDQVKYVVLDEADEMLNMGFVNDIDDILSQTPEDKSVWLFSATMPQEIKRISAKYMSNPLEITVGTRNSSNANISHQYYVTSGRDKYAALKRVVDSCPEIFGIIFCKTKSDTQKVSDTLCKEGYNADALHGDLSQAQRDRVMRNFKARQLQILVATDVAARGIDVDNVTHVVNYGLPEDIESYTHRSGRTARAGRQGISLAIIESRDFRKIAHLESKINTKFERMMIPSGEEVCEKQLEYSISKLKDVEVEESRISQFIPALLAAFEGLSKEDIIKKLATAELERFLSYYQKAPNLNVRDDEFRNISRDSRKRGSDDFSSRGRFDRRGGDRPERGGFRDRPERGGERSERFERGDRADRPERSSEGGFASKRNSDEDRVFINVGRVDGLKRKDILKMLVDVSGIDERSIGDIDDKGTFSFVQLKKDKTEKVLHSFRDYDYDGKQIRIEVSKHEPRKGGNSAGYLDRPQRPRPERSSDNGGARPSSSFGGDRRGGSDDRRSSDRGGDRSSSRPSRNESFDNGSKRKENDLNLSDLFSEPGNYF